MQQVQHSPNLFAVNLSGHCIFSGKQAAQQGPGLVFNERWEEYSCALETVFCCWGKQQVEHSPNLRWYEPVGQVMSGGKHAFQHGSSRGAGPDGVSPTLIVKLSSAGVGVAMAKAASTARVYWIFIVIKSFDLGTIWYYFGSDWEGIKTDVGVNTFKVGENALYLCSF